MLPEPTPENLHINTDARAKFGNWLKKDEQELFWICGKAGSGKSTMMKRIFQLPQMQQSVKAWAHPCPVAFASFYFYQREKSALQKSNEGLLRALLYQIIKQVPSLSALVMEVMTPPGECSTNIETFEWKFDGLRKAIENIKEYSSRTGEIKFCIFIDGLDEYQSFDEIMQGQSNIQGKLAANTWESSKHRQSLQDIGNLVLELASSPQVKLCCSSRPETAFDCLFHKMPSIKLEHLTELDIGRFVSEKLEESEAMSSSPINPAERSKLIQKTVLKARGVFLWVKLVVDRVMEEMEDGSMFDELDRLLRSLPSELFGLYKEMLSKSDPQHLKQGFELFRTLPRAQKGHHCTNSILRFNRNH